MEAEGELRIAVGDVLALIFQGGNDICEGTQALVDRQSFLESFTFNFRFVKSFRTCKIYQAQSLGDVTKVDLYLEDGMTAGTISIAGSTGNLSILLGFLQELKDFVGRSYLNHSRFILAALVILCHHVL